MNIITKIKNWIIKKLGGYTEEEYTKFVYIAKEYHDKYAAAHNAYNTLAEQKQKPIEMAKALKAYCAIRDDCEGCELHNTEHCKLSYKACPEYWEVE